MICIEYNSDKFIRSNLIFYFISFIIYLYNQDFEQYTDFEMIKFSHILTIDNDISDISWTDSTIDGIITEDMSEDQVNEIKNDESDYFESINSLDTEQNGDDDEEALFENLDISGRFSLY